MARTREDVEAEIYRTMETITHVHGRIRATEDRLQIHKSNVVRLEAKLRGLFNERTGLS